MLPSKGNECNAAQAKITNLKKKKKKEKYPLGMVMKTVGSEADSLGYSL